MYLFVLYLAGSVNQYWLSLVKSDSEASGQKNTEKKLEKGDPKETEK